MKMKMNRLPPRPTPPPTPLFSLIVLVAAAALLHARDVACFQSPFVLPSLPLPATTVPSSSSSSTSPLFCRTKLVKPVTLSSFPSSSSALSSTASPTSSDTQLTESKDDNDDVGLGAWIPLASISQLTGLGPQRITIMNIDIAVWQNEVTNKWTAQVDACAHRLAPLSQGRVDPKTNCIECLYHGWQFDGNGTVTSIPQLDLDEGNENSKEAVEEVSKSNAGMNVMTFPTHAVDDDLLFVFLSLSLHGEAFPQSLLPEDYYPFLKKDDDESNDNDSEKGKDNDAKSKAKTKSKSKSKPKPPSSYFSRKLPYSFDFLVENFMDPAHIPFAHHKLQSTCDDGSAIQMKPLVLNFTHVQVSFRDISAKRRRDAYASFQRPAFYHFGERRGDIVDDSTGERSGEFTPSLIIYLCPVRAGSCRVFIKSPSISLLGGLVTFPKWLLHAGSNRFLNSDTWLHDTEREVVRRKEMAMAVTNSNGNGNGIIKRNMDSKANISKKLCQMDYQYISKSDFGILCGSMGLFHVVTFLIKKYFP